MALPKRSFIVGDNGALVSGERLSDIPPGLLNDGAEVGIYGLLRIKRVEVTRKLVKMDGDSLDESEEEQVQLFTDAQPA